ncbi:hypothetical protein CALVIDRAFT_547668 [Calocera viscosa TUFC12733]|uniref:Uncharacterized protein n=1 Tax=Calocera viscosa (strain TUFC12733) TaxID=1330018 RepID=A0A167G094_CALVF|nr:hypothetical protein CALVIDRAFT_547668 [Calocera viscosa TUFC12733]
MHPIYPEEVNVDHFLQHDWVKIPSALLPEWSDKFTFAQDGEQYVWSTWTRDRANMPRHQSEKASVVAPTAAWDAICDLLGGKERIGESWFEWRDGYVSLFIVNLGTEEWENKEVDLRDLDNWHVDGDSFKHVAEYLKEHREGTYPASGGGFKFKNLIPKWNEFVEATLRIPRLITNPAVSVKVQFNFSRENPEEYSLVELKTLKALGADKLDHKIPGGGQRIRPLRIDFWEPQI